MKVSAVLNEFSRVFFVCTLLPSKVSEKTDSYVDSLRLGLEVWEKQLMLGEELDVWAAAKLGIFAESHPFSSEKEVFEMKVWRSTSC